MADAGGIDPKRAITETVEEALRCEAAKQPFMTRWQELADYIVPGDGDFTSMRSPADKRMTKVYDPTQIHANEMLAAGLHGQATNPTTNWIDGFDAFTTTGEKIESDEAAEYCELRRDIVLDEFNRAGFATSIHEVYLTLPAIATACLFTGWNPRRDCLQFEARHMSEISVKLGPDGMVETVYRFFSWPARLVAEKWTEERCSDATRRLLASPQTRETLVRILHVMTPRAQRDYLSIRPDQMAVASQYIEVEAKHKLEDSGWPEPAYAVPRWSRTPGSTYGNRSPGWNCLADIKQLQLGDKDTTTFIQKLTDPNLLAPDDGFIGPYRSKPGGVSYYRQEYTGEQFKWWEPGSSPEWVLKWADGRRDRIRLGFYLDLFDFTPQGQPLTATEANIRNDRLLRLLAPLHGRLQMELLEPTVTRADGLLYRARRIPPLPASMWGCRLVPRFMSPIQVAQRQVDLQSIYRAIEIDTAIAAVDPNAPPVMDWDKAKRWSYDRAGVPRQLVRSRDAVLAEKQQAAAMAAATQTAQAASLGGQAALSVAKARQTAAETEQL